MSRTNIATQIPVGPYPAGGIVAALALDLAWVGADVSNHNEFQFTGKEVLLVWNTDTASHNLTVTSAPDEHGRADDIASYAVAAGVVSAFSFRAGGAGWLQSDGHVYFQGDNALLKFAILSVNN
jgi:hypothetical protein